MRHLTYYLSLLFALPCTAFALFILTIGHVIATRNPFVLLYHFLLAFAWGLPILVVVIVALIVAGLFPRGRIAASMVIITVDLAALVIVAMSPAAPRELADLPFLAAPVVSIVLGGLLLHDARSAQARPA